jgi:hypothetical protein
MHPERSGVHGIELSGTAPPVFQVNLNVDVIADICDFFTPKPGVHYLLLR